jgi:hypothetical protein
MSPKTIPSADRPIAARPDLPRKAVGSGCEVSGAAWPIGSYPAIRVASCDTEVRSTLTQDYIEFYPGDVSAAQAVRGHLRI